MKLTRARMPDTEVGVIFLFSFVFIQPKCAYLAFKGGTHTKRDQKWPSRRQASCVTNQTNNIKKTQVIAKGNFI